MTNFSDNRLNVVSQLPYIINKSTRGMISQICVSSPPVSGDVSLNWAGVSSCVTVQTVGEGTCLAGC